MRKRHFVKSSLLALALFALLCGSWAVAEEEQPPSLQQSSERGLTTPALTRTGVADDSMVERTEIVPAETIEAAGSAEETRDTTDWMLVDTDTFFTFLRADERCVLHYDSDAGTISVILPDDPVTLLAYQAIDYAPDWLSLELRDAFGRLDSDFQDSLAQIILDAVDPYVDEVAFLVAHTAPEVLTHASLYTDLFLENAVGVYAADPYLDYADIVDYGSASVGGDYYSTISYQTAAARGTTTVELPKERYYWDIVHFRITDEIPTYIDPATGGSTDPPTGRFWREYVFTHADSGYPILRDALAGVQTLWEGNVDSKTNGAVGVVTQWIQDCLNFGSGAERPIQPVRILAIHLGRCGEHADITAAAARAALISTNSPSAIASDHTWNEFWDRRWIPWEPVNNYVDSGWHYEGWGKSFNAIFNWRGDDWTWTVTERYTPACTLVVAVTDSFGYPVDGARVTVAKRGDGAVYSVSAWDYTDHNGNAQFMVGDNQEIRVRFDSDIGTWPSGPLYRMVCELSIPDTLYYYSRGILGERPQTPILPAPPPLHRSGEYQMRVNWGTSDEFIYGANQIGGSKVFSRHLSGGAVNFFICDETNYAAYTSPDTFYAYEIMDDEDSADVAFTLPGEGDWYAVLSNEEHIVNSQIVQGTVEIYYRVETGVADGGAPALRTTLGENRPNPFNPLTTIRFSMAEEGPVQIAVYDISGRQVRTLLSGMQPAGEHETVWNGTGANGRPVAAGIYFCRMKTGDETLSRKMVLLK